MGSQYSEELSRSKNSDALVLLREMASIAGNEIFRPALQSTVQDLVVFRIRRHQELLLKLEEGSRFLQ